MLTALYDHLSFSSPSSTLYHTALLEFLESSQVCHSHRLLSIYLNSSYNHYTHNIQCSRLTAFASLLSVRQLTTNLIGRKALFWLSFGREWGSTAHRYARPSDIVWHLLHCYLCTPTLVCSLLLLLLMTMVMVMISTLTSPPYFLQLNHCTISP